MIALLLVALIARDELTDAIKKLRAAADLSAKYQAAYDLGRVLQPKQIPIVLKELDAGPADMRTHFITAIRTCGGPEAVKALKGLLGRHEVKSRVEAAYALKILGDDEGMKGLPLLLQPALAKEDKMSVIQHLNASYYAGAEVPAALRTFILAEKDADVRKSAVLALISHKDPESAPFLKRIANDEVDPLRFYALCALIKLGDADAIERGLTLLEKGGLEVSALYDVIYALRIAGGREVADRLRAMLQKATEVNVVIQLINALADLKDGRSIPYLTKYVDDKNSSVCEAAIRALVELGGKSQIDLLKKLLTRAAPVNIAAAEALVALDDPSGIPILKESLSDKSQYYRQRSATALGVLRVPEVVPGLIVALADDDLSVRTSASTALIGALRHLYPYRKFDFAEVGYDAKSTDAVARGKAIEQIKAWWEKNKQ